MTRKLPHGLGRVKRFDTRSLTYSVAERLDALGVSLDAPLVSRTLRRPAAIDQGQTPQCVGHSLWGAVNCQPLTARYSYATRRHYTPTDIYHGAQEDDEYPGVDYDGSSVLGGSRWLVQVGVIREYLWCFSLQEVLQTLSTGLGSVVVGTDWYGNMFDGPDPDPGRSARPEYALDVDGYLAGGHAWHIHGIRPELKVVIATNSWSTSWGDDGRMYLTFEDLNTLLQAEGEAAVLL